MCRTLRPGTNSVSFSKRPASLPKTTEPFSSRKAMPRVSPSKDFWRAPVIMRSLKKPKWRVEDVDVEMFGEEEESDENGLGGEGLPIIRQQQQQDDTMTAGEDDVVMTEETDTKDDEVDSDLDDMF